MKLRNWGWWGAAGCGLLLLLSGCAHRVLVQPVLDMNQYNRIAVLPFETDSYLSTVVSTWLNARALMRSCASKIYPAITS